MGEDSGSIIRKLFDGFNARDYDAITVKLRPTRCANVWV